MQKTGREKVGNTEIIESDSGIQMDSELLQDWIGYPMLCLDETEDVQKLINKILLH